MKIFPQGKISLLLCRFLDFKRERTDSSDYLVAISASLSHINLIDLNPTKAYFFRKTFGFAIKFSSDREYIMSSGRLF